MRNTMLWMSVIMALASGPSDAENAKAPPPDVGVGRVAWFDVTTTDLKKSTDFYGKLFAWTFAPLAGTELAVEIVAGGSPIGTLRGAEGQISGFNGVVYIQVTDVRASCNKAKELGATIVPGFPFNLPDGTGAICLILDPVGHPMGLYARTMLAAR